MIDADRVFIELVGLVEDRRTWYPLDAAPW
jgi:hypothetical protein